MPTKNKTYYLNSNGTRVNSKKTFLKFLNFHHKRKLFHVIDRSTSTIHGTNTWIDKNDILFVN